MGEQDQEYLEDDAYLEQLGVQPKLKRGLNLIEQGLFGVAFQGPTAGSILVTSAAFAVAGPAFIWVFPVCLILQTVLAVLWGEMASQYPLTGGIYQWAKYLGGEWWGWLTAVFYTATVVIIQAVLGVIVNVILNGLAPSIAFSDRNSVIIAVILSIVAGLVISRSVRLAGLLNGVGVFMELFILFGATVFLLFHVRQPLHVIFDTAGTQGHGSYFVPFTVAIALEFTLLTGFETAGFFSEEVRHSRAGGPRAIIMACVGTTVFTGLFGFAMLLATRSIPAAMSAGPDWVPLTLRAALGTAGEKIFLTAALIALLSTAIANMGAMTRLIYGMGRDGYVPGSAFLTRLSARNGEPTTAVVVAVFLSFVPLLIISKVTVVIDAISGLMLFTYLITAGASLRRRFAGWPTKRAPFRLGSWGVPLTLVGLAWIVFVLLLTAWPHDATNPTLGLTRVIWEIVVGLVALAGIGWLLKAHRASLPETSGATEELEDSGKT